MYQLRPFLNSDPPHLADIWRSQPPHRGLVQPVSAAVLEYGVFSKMHFDRQGMIVATRDGEPVGFVHAGFGPNDDGTALDCSLGTTYLMMIRPGQEDDALENDMLAASEQYLRDMGASVLYAGGIRPLNSFYLGLYGGSEIPGVLKSNPLLQDVVVRNGYTESAHVKILHSDLASFRQPVSHKVRQVKRTAQVVETVDPVADSWWDACVWGCLQRDKFDLVDRWQGHVLATASVWDVQPLSTCWGICTAGLSELYVDPDRRRQGYATYLLSEAFRLLRRRGVNVIEAQTMATNEAALAFYEKLGFAEVDEGTVYRKDAASSNGQGLVDRNGH